MKTWNLDALYPSFDSTEFQEDVQKIGNMVEDVLAFAQKELTDTENAHAKLRAYLSKTEAMRDIVHRTFAFCSLSMSV